MTKDLTKDEALAKISALIKKHYEHIGREIIEDLDEEREELIEGIEDILSRTKIPIKNLIIEQLEIDEEIKDSLKGRWK